MEYLFDLLPEELVFELFFLLKVEAVKLGNINDRLGSIFNKFVDKVYRGLIPPDLIFYYEMDISHPLKWFSIGNTKVEESSDIYLSFLLKFVGHLVDKKFGPRDISIDFNGEPVDMENYDLKVAEMLSHCNRHKVYLNVGSNELSTAQTQSIYVIMQNAMATFVYIELNIDDPLHIKVFFIVTKSWKELWAQTSPKIRGVMLTTYKYI